MPNIQNIALLQDFELLKDSHDAAGQQKFLIRCQGPFISQGLSAPDIPLPVDIAQKLAARPDVTRRFVTLPLGQYNAQSRNNHGFPPEEVDRMSQQINEERLEGQWGHLTDEQLGHIYTPPAVRWVASMIDNDGILWGKGLPLTPDAIKYFDDAELTGASVGTSILGRAFVDEDQMLHDIRLISIDLADPQRVGVPITAAKPLLTYQMSSKIGDTPMPSTVPQQAPNHHNPAPSAVEAPAAPEQKQPTVQEAAAPAPTPAPASNISPVIAELQSSNQLLTEQLTRSNQALQFMSNLLQALRQRFSIDPSLSGDEAVRQMLSTVDELETFRTDAVSVVVDEMVQVESVRPLAADMLLRNPKLRTREQFRAELAQMLVQPSFAALIVDQAKASFGPNARPSVSAPKTYFAAPKTS